MLQWIEVVTMLQIPGLQIVGLASREVGEAKERVKSAILASNLPFPKKRVVLNLSPAHLPKQGTGTDLSMALAILVGESKTEAKKVLAWGELSLHGEVRSVGQNMRVLIAALENQIPLLILPETDRASVSQRLELLKSSESTKAKDLPKIIYVQNLAEAYDYLTTGREPKTPKLPTGQDTLEASSPNDHSLLPLSKNLLRMIEISITGSHHLLLIGPRGAGKSHALLWWRALQLEASAEIRIEQALLLELSEPFSAIPKKAQRSIGAHARPQALIGSLGNGGSGGNGGKWIPGEFSKAHGGALFADELPEWHRDTREVFREPLERGVITLNRRESMEFPARFTLVANGNPCGCGGWPKAMPVASKKRICQCLPHEEAAYRKRLSGPILDRIDLVSWVTPETPQQTPSIDLEALKSKLAQAASWLQAKYGEVPGRISAQRLEDLLQAHPDYRSWLNELTEQKGASLRSRHKILRVALTLAALEEPAGLPTHAHFQEAFYYRPEALGWGED